MEPISQKEVRQAVAKLSQVKMSARVAVKQGILASGLLRFASRLSQSKVTILRYHSVLHEPAGFAFSIGAGIIHSAKSFTEQMEYVAKRCNPVTIDCALSFAKGACELPRRAIVVSFDDGFADNLEVASPILQRFGIRAVIYVAASYIGSVPWFCRIRYAFFTSRKDIFTDPFDGTTHRIGLESVRYAAFLKCARFCASSNTDEIEMRVALIENALEVKLQPQKPLMLDWEGVRQLAKVGHTIGSHTMTHPNLAYVSKSEASQQLRDSKKAIEQNFGQEIRHFSYPSPIMEPHWTNDTIKACVEAGYETAVTCIAGSVRRRDNPLLLRRIPAPSSTPEFIWKLENEFIGHHV